MVDGRWSMVDDRHANLKSTMSDTAVLRFDASLFASSVSDW
jgi:hypothetical protein